jgi:hypothetical protein
VIYGILASIDSVEHIARENVENKWVKTAQMLFGKQLYNKDMSQDEFERKKVRILHLLTDLLHYGSRMEVS